MRKRFRTQSEEEQEEEPLINLTPLIDVVFVVLITFILIAPVLNIDSVNLAEGGPSSKGAAQQPSPITISVHADNSIWIDGQSVTLAQVEKRLKEEKKRHPNVVPQLLQDSRAQFGTYQIVKNLVEEAGFAQLDIVLKPAK